MHSCTQLMLTVESKSRIPDISGDFEIPARCIFLGLKRETSLTEYGEVSGRYGVVACSRGRCPAQVRAAVMSFNSRDDQVPVSQHSGPGHIYGFRVGPAPGHKRPRVSLRKTLQNHRLTQPDADVLRSCYDVWFHERPRTRRWRGTETIQWQATASFIPEMHLIMITVHPHTNTDLG